MENVFLSFFAVRNTDSCRAKSTLCNLVSLVGPEEDSNNETPSALKVGQPFFVYINRVQRRVQQTCYR